MAVVATWATGDIESTLSQSIPQKSTSHKGDKRCSSPPYSARETSPKPKAPRRTSRTPPLPVSVTLQQADAKKALLLSYQ